MKTFSGFIFALVFSFASLYAAQLSAQDLAQDAEQNNLRLCYQFSKLLGCEVDTLTNPGLYQTVDEWLGTPYKYSGDCREGIDCSGFVSMLYLKVYGVELAHSSSEIFKDSKPLKKNALKEGDLVFFKIKKHRISHVGIYMGNNKFAHASVQNGVIISDLDEPYYKKYFFKGGKVNK